MKIYLAQNLLWYRRYNSLIQTEFAEKLSVTIGSYKSYELGKAHPTLETLLRLKQVTGIEIDTFLCFPLTNVSYASYVKSKMNTNKAFELFVAISELQKKLEKELMNAVNKTVNNLR